MKQLTAATATPAVPEIVDSGLALDPRVHEIVRLYDSLAPRDRAAVARHVNGVTRLESHDPDDSLAPRSPI